jgi:hypothetical protein
MGRPKRVFTPEELTIIRTLGERLKPEEIALLVEAGIHGVGRVLRKEEGAEQGDWEPWTRKTSEWALQRLLVLSGKVKEPGASDWLQMMVNRLYNKLGPVVLGMWR